MMIKAGAFAACSLQIIEANYKQANGLKLGIYG